MSSEGRHSTFGELSSSTLQSMCCDLPARTMCGRRDSARPPKESFGTLQVCCAGCCRQCRPDSVWVFVCMVLGNNLTVSDAGGVPQWSNRASSTYECKCKSTGCLSECQNGRSAHPPAICSTSLAFALHAAGLHFSAFVLSENLIPSSQQAGRNPCQRQGFVRCAPAHHCSLLCCGRYAMLDPEAERIG